MSDEHGNQFTASTPQHRAQPRGSMLMDSNTVSNDFNSTSMECKVCVSTEFQRRLDIHISITGIFQVGEEILIKYTMTNLFGFDLEDCEFTDLDPTQTTPALFDLDIGESESFEVSYTLTQSDIDNGSISFESSGEGTRVDNSELVEASKTKETMKSPS